MTYPSHSLGGRRVREPFIDPGMALERATYAGPHTTLRFRQGWFHALSHALTDLRTTTSQNCEAVPRRARIYGPKTFVSLNSRFERNKEERKKNDIRERVTNRAA